jgi:hypothetical protein
MTRLTMFSWGYDGWGSSTKQLKRSVDAIEEKRGFEPPLFVDIRHHRSARAKDFRGNGFGKIIGQDRYLWMPSLGNAKVRKGKMQIAFPKAASELLWLGNAESKRNRRIVFFCACGDPIRIETRGRRKPKKVRCHRFEVAKLLQREAKKIGLGLRIEHWPGSGVRPPKHIKLPHDEFSKIERKKPDKENVRVRLSRMPEIDVLSLPWGTAVKLKHRNKDIRVIADPAFCDKNGWFLRLPRCHVGHQALGERKKINKQRGYGFPQ